jgi:carotenoid cleavage dioxygenase-like enzyme
MSISDGAPNERRLIASIRSSNTPYFHSYGVSQNYAVLGFTPMSYEMGPSLLGEPMVSSFKTAHPNVTTFHIVNLQTGNVQPIRADSAFTYDHLVNAYENGTDIVFDACVFKDATLWLVDGETDLNIQRNKARRDSMSFRSQVVRFVLDTISGTVKSSQELSPGDTMIDFPKIHPQLSGLPYCVYYAVEWFHNHEVFASMAILKHNVCTDEHMHWYIPGWYPSEPTFIPSTEPGAEEDAGVLSFSALDGAKNTSHLIMLNATTMEPMVDQPLPHVIPFTTHGQFYAN